MGFASYFNREKPSVSAALGALALFPLVFVWFVANYSHADPYAAREASVSVLLMALLFAAVGSTICGIGLSKFWRFDSKSKSVVGLSAIVFGLLTFPLYVRYRASYGWEGSFEDFPYVSAIQGLLGGCLYSLLPVSTADTRQLTRGWFIAIAVALVPAVYFFPDIAFRMRRYGTQMTTTERVGAQRAAKGGPSTLQAQRALAQAGDSQAISLLIDQISRAEIVEREFEMVQLAGQLSSDRKLKQALLDGFQRSLDRFKMDNTFDESDRAVEAYCEALNKCVDRRAVPNLIRAYNLSETQMNIRNAAATTLGNVFYLEAEPFIAEELKKLHPIRDKKLAKQLAGGHSIKIQELLARFQEAGAKQQSRLDAKNVPVQDLIRTNNIDALADRALSNDRGADVATVELIKRKHPKRFEAVEKHAGRWIRGRNFTTFRDPELAAFIMKKDLMKIDNWHLTRFLCEWAPMESCATLGRLLKTQFASSAVVGLTHCRHSDAPKLLLGRLRAYRPGDGALAHALIRALGMRVYEPAAPVIGEWASGSKSAGSFVVDGTPVDVKEVARWALSRMGSSEARRLAAKYPVGDTDWVQKWKWQ